MTRRQDDSPTNGFIWQSLQQADEKWEDGHKRLRDDYRALERRLTSMEEAQVANGLRFSKLENTPTDVTKLQFTTKTVLAIVLAACGVVGAQYTSSAMLEGKLLKAISDNAKVQDERQVTLKDSINAITRMQTTQSYELGNLKQAISVLQAQWDGQNSRRTKR